MRSKSVASVAAVLMLSGCFGGASVPDQLLTLTPAQTRPVTSPVTAAQGEAITVVEPSVPQALQTTRVPVYVSETAIQYLQDAQWVENPAPLFGRLVGEVIGARSGRVVLDPAQYSHDPGTRLTGQLLRFGLDPTRMEVVLVYEAAVTREAGITTNRFETRVPVAEASAAAVAPALNAAANQAAEQIAAWVAGLG